MSWRDISLTWPCYQTHDGATILSGVAFTRGPRPVESSSFALRRNGCFGSYCSQLHNRTLPNCIVFEMFRINAFCWRVGRTEARSMKFCTLSAYCIEYR
jgi:hypothetical protein